MIGPSATAGQMVNGQLATCLYHCWSRLETLEDDHVEGVYAVVKPSVKVSGKYFVPICPSLTCISSQSIFRAYERIVDPLLTSIRRELGAIIARLHRIDFAKSVDPMSGMGGGSSMYMKDLVDKLSFIKSEVLAKFNVGEAGRAWVMAILKFVIRTFVLHVSIAKPLGESGKLQLTSDMTELEFGLSAFMVEDKQSKRGGNLESIGNDYRTLRAMRSVLRDQPISLTRS